MCFRDDPANLQSILIHCDARVTPNPICTAATRGFNHSLESLLKDNAVVNGIHPPYYVGNPLLRALRLGNNEAVQILEEYGADFDIRCRQGALTTVLERAAHVYSNPRLLERLLRKKNIDTNMVDCVGRTIVSTSPMW